MNQFIKQFKFPICLACGLYLIFYFTQTDQKWKMSFSSQEAAAKSESDDLTRSKNYDLEALNVLNRVVMYIEDNYVDPKRINRRKMMGSALETIQKEVPEFMVQLTHDPKGQVEQAHLKLNEVKKSFSLDRVNNRYHLIFAFKDIFKFMKGNLKYFEDLQKIEYAAINGMLSTLDPHSLLLTADEYAEMKLSTRGRFGGLGIVIGIRDSQLTVINPIEDTPASRAGIQATYRLYSCL